MRILVLLLLPVWLCSACTALPAEERAFAVALCVEKAAEEWRVHGRIPTYQPGGGYMTVAGEGGSFSAALADMDAASPMRINLSQLRLLAVDVSLAESGGLLNLLTTLSNRRDMRMQCAVALTDEPLQSVAEALKPAAGTRLSKALDLMLDARMEQGAILPATLSDVLRMGERQSPILIALAMAEGDVSLSGGYTADGVYLSVDETALLSLLLGHAKTLRIEVTEGSAEVRDAAVKVCLDEDLARVELTLTATASSLTQEALEQGLADSILGLLTRLSTAGCDVLGLGRQAAMHTHDVTQWHTLNWPEKYRDIRWQVSVGVSGPA